MQKEENYTEIQLTRKQSTKLWELITYHSNNLKHKWLFEIHLKMQTAWIEKQDHITTSLVKDTHRQKNQRMEVNLHRKKIEGETRWWKDPLHSSIGESILKTSCVTNKNHQNSNDSFHRTRKKVLKLIWKHKQPL